MSEKSTFYSKDPASVSGDKSIPLTIEDVAPSSKASFYAKEPTPASSNGSKAAVQKKYMGEERRKGNRRANQDRRGEVRFELNKSDRRQSQGRRSTDITPKFW